MTKFDEDQTKIVDFLLVVYFWVSVIFLDQALFFNDNELKTDEKKITPTQNILLIKIPQF